MAIGEEVAIALLRDKRMTIREPFEGFTRFDGSRVSRRSASARPRGPLDRTGTGIARVLRDLPGGPERSAIGCGETAPAPRWFNGALEALADE